MDKSKYETVDFTMGNKSDDCRVSFETPSNTPPRYVREQVFYYTPCNSPVKMHSCAKNYDLGECACHDSSCDSESESKKNISNTKKNFTISVSRASAKTCSDSEENGCWPRDGENNWLPSTGKSYSYLIGFGKGEPKTDDRKTCESCHDNSDIVAFNLDDDTVNPNESDDVLKKFTCSPEFLYLKNSLLTSDDETCFPVVGNQERQADVALERHVSFVSKTLAATARKTSLTNPNAKKEFSFGRKSSLDDLISDKPFAPNNRECKNEFVSIQEVDGNNVSFKNAVNRKEPTLEMEEPWSLKNLKIVEPTPNIRYGSNFESSLTFDFNKSKKPSTRLGDLLEYCKKDPKCKADGKNVTQKTDPVVAFPDRDEMLFASEMNKNLNLPARGSLEKQIYRKCPSSNVLNGISQKTRRYGNLVCCSNPGDEILFFDAQDPTWCQPEAIEDPCFVDDNKVIKSTPRCGSESTGSKEKKGDLNCMSLARNDEKCFTRNTRKNDKPSCGNINDSRQFRRADQSYCELIKQQHEEMKKHRAKRSKKQVERICRSDPPDKLAGGDIPWASLIESEEIKKRLVLDLCHQNRESKDGVCDLCSSMKGTQEKSKIDRTESLYDNKTSCARIHSFYENQKKSNNHDGGFDDRTNYFKSREENLASFSQVHAENHPRSDAAVMHKSWWPVVQQSGYEWWMHPFEVKELDIKFREKD